MRVQLRVYSNPGGADAFLNLKRPNGSFIRWAAMVDTGAEVTTLPEKFLPDLDYRLSERGRAEVLQAGIASQRFEVIEAYISVFLEDQAGNKTDEFEILAWFTPTDEALIGFGGILDRTVLHLDMPALTGYLDFPD